MTPACHICGNPRNPWLKGVADPNSRDRFDVSRCSFCGLGHTEPLPADISRYYADSYYGNRHGWSGRMCIARRLRWASGAVKATGRKSERRLLDVGCGDGAFLLAARKNGWTCTGIERNTTPARRAGLDVRESLGDLQDHAPFDCISFWHSLEHMSDLKTTLKRTSALLHPKGAAIIAVPDKGGLQARLFGRRWLHLDVPRHYYHFDSRSLDQALQQAGLVVRRTFHQELEYDLLGWSQSAMNRLLPRFPNLFFRQLTGKPANAPPWARAVSRTLGPVLTLLALPAVWCGTLLRQGGTLIMIAGRPDPKKPEETLIPE